MTAFSIIVPGPDDWRAVRDLRLAALSTDPRSFGSTWQRESGFDEATWRQRCCNPAQFIALLGTRPVGLAALLPEAPGTPHRHLVSVWTAPEARGHGVAEALVRACIDAARSSGAARLTLVVAQHADAARRLYLRLGFVPTGVHERLPWDDAVLLDEMSLDLATP